MTIGQAYTPYKLFNPVILPPGLLSYSGKAGTPPKKLSDGAKLLFGLLNYHGGHSGQFPHQRTLAAGAGVSLDTVKRYVEELEAHKLLKSVQHGRGKPNSYLFIWHEALNNSVNKKVANMPPQEETPEEGERVADLPPQENGKGGSSEALGWQSCGEKVADLPLPIKEEQGFNRNKEQESSSSGFSTSTGSSHSELGESTTTSSPFFEKETPTPDSYTESGDQSETPSQTLSVKENQEDWRTEQVARDFKALLHQHKNRVAIPGGTFELCPGPLPPPSVVRGILANFLSEKDANDWYLDMEQRHLTGARFRSYGVYLTDSQEWPERRADVLLVREQQDVERRRREVEQAAAWERNEAENQAVRARCEEEERKRQRSLAWAALMDCRKCGRTGIRRSVHESAPDTFDWCGCEHTPFAQELRGDDYIAKMNAETGQQWEVRVRVRQSTRWCEHPRYKQLRASGNTMELDGKFFVAEIDEREEMLKSLESGEFDQKPATPSAPSAPPPTPMHSITQADIDAAQAKRRRGAA